MQNNIKNKNVKYKSHFTYYKVFGNSIFLYKFPATLAVKRTPRYNTPYSFVLYWYDYVRGSTQPLYTTVQAPGKVTLVSPPNEYMGDSILQCQILLTKLLNFSYQAGHYCYFIR